MKPRVVVVAGVIERDGKILICQRRANSLHPLKWEFPGGKVEPGEEPRDALVRELEEELGIRAVPGVEDARYEHTYPNRAPVLLIFFRVPTFEGELDNREFERIVWEDPERLPDYDFLEGDLDFVAQLARS